MKKETTAKTPSKPKGNEKKVSAKKEADSYPGIPAIKGTEVTCRAGEQVSNHASDQLTNQAAPPVPSDGLIAEGGKTPTAPELPH